MPSHARLPNATLLVLLASVGVLLFGGSFHAGPAPLSVQGDRTNPSHAAILGTTLPRVAEPRSMGVPIWVNVTPRGPSPNPPAAAGGSMAYDSLDHATIYFGGCAKGECPNNQTWSYANGTWTNLTDRYDAPPARYGAVMVYDPNMQGILLFGGSPVRAGYLNDTWLFHGGSWTNLTYVSAVAPAPRKYATMAFDPAPEENGSVLFGGSVYGVGPVNDTWIWQGWSGWQFLNTSSAPPDTELASMAYDPTIQAIVLFGCGDGCVTGNNATWELYSGQWWQVLPKPPVPVYRYGAVMTWDPALQEILLFGGYSFTGYLSDAWAFTSGRWAQLTSFGTPPPGRYLPACSTNSSGFPLVLFGGSRFWPYDLSQQNDTWVLELPPTASLGALPAAVEVSTPVNLSVTVGNGTAPYSALFAFGDGGGAHAAGPGPAFWVSHAYLTPGTVFPLVRVSDAAGATVYAGAVAGTGLLVTPGPSLGPIASPPATDVNISVHLTGSSAAAGQSPYAYLWSFGDGSTAAGQDAIHAYALPGTYAGTLTATDANGVTATTGFSATIHPLPTLSVAASPTPAAAGTPATFYGNISGGLAPFTYAWSFGDGKTSSLPYPSHNFSASGNYTVGLTITDSVGASAHQSIVEKVRPASSPSGPLPTNSSTSSAGVPVWFWPGVGAIVAVGVVGSILLFRRGAKGPSV